MRYLSSIALLIVFTLCPMHPNVLAQETAGDYVAGMGKNIGRGLINVVSSPAEIPCTMRDDVRDQGGVGYATGFGKGLLFFVRRAVIGVCEIGTFILPSEATIPPVCHTETAV